MGVTINKVTLLGNLGADPELRYSQHGKKIARFSLATNEKWNRETGAHEHTEWHSIVAWERNAEIVMQYLHTGSRVLVEGRIRSRKWTDDSLLTHYRSEINASRIIMLDPHEPVLSSGMEDIEYDYYPF